MNERDRRPSNVDLRGRRLAVLGGDKRMLEIMRQARLAGADVVACGTAPGTERAAGRAPVATLAEAIAGAHMVICPVPGVGADVLSRGPMRTSRPVLP